MTSRYKPVIIVIKKKSTTLERSLELPLDPLPPCENPEPVLEPQRGITVIKIHGDEKI
jgi:hypothetical protein